MPQLAMPEELFMLRDMPGGRLLRDWCGQIWMAKYERALRTAAAMIRTGEADELIAIDISGQLRATIRKTFGTIEVTTP